MSISTFTSTSAPKAMGHPRNSSPWMTCGRPWRSRLRSPLSATTSPVAAAVRPRPRGTAEGDVALRGHGRNGRLTETMWTTTWRGWRGGPAGQVRIALMLTILFLLFYLSTPDNPDVNYDAVLRRPLLPSQETGIAEGRSRLRPEPAPRRAERSIVEGRDVQRTHVGRTLPPDVVEDRRGVLQATWQACLLLADTRSRGGDAMRVFGREGRVRQDTRGRGQARRSPQFLNESFRLRRRGTRGTGPQSPRFSRSFRASWSVTSGSKTPPAPAMGAQTGIRSLIGGGTRAATGPSRRPRRWRAVVVGLPLPLLIH